ncbi:RNB domain-containing ribonuclease [Ramlibacter sp.]|uniref:RNB domain-containing ribonuclease n=1 Tax=Ramlibacter sp. TaxID=1917967 RepID=UPI003D132725
MPANDLQAFAIAAMRARGLRPQFLREALAQADAATPTNEAPADVRDLRELHWFSIDNDESLDLDQLSVAEAMPDGQTRLRVAVADVDARVPAGSAIDEHAAANTTSVYAASGVFPMLPERLSNDLTSLNEGCERLAVVVDMVVSPEGEVREAQLYRGLVVNRAKLAYGPVSAWLDGDGAAPAAVERSAALEAQVRLHDDVAARLREKRQSRGALEVKTVSGRPVFDANGVLVDIAPDEKNRAKELIADLMIAANSATARYLVQRRSPSLRRVLEAPRRWDRMVTLAATHGYALPAQADPVALDDFLRERRVADPSAFGDLSLAIVKMLGPGEYAAAAPGEPSIGHFGLAVSDYTHSTAPNRRYTDLVTQRLIKAAIAGAAPPYDVDALAAIARHCTLQEDNAAKVERQVLKAAAALLLAPRIGEAFDALVTGAKAAATYVRIARPLVEGRLVRGFEGADVGDALRVRLVGVDAAQGFIDFERA